jgi:CheY-like chemotaxis protein
MGSTRVLVIDDELRDRQLVTAVLESAGYRVHGAAGGASGLRLAEADPPDIVVLDLQMPGMEGYDVCRRLQQDPRTQRIPVVLLTASGDPALHRKAYAAGAVACVPKPFRKAGLLAAIQATLADALRKESGTPPEAAPSIHPSPPSSN